MSVIAGVDNSPVAQLVVERGIEQARWRDEELHVVHVSHFPVVYTEVAIDWGEVTEAERGEVWRELGPTLDDADVIVHRIDLEGYPPDTLVGYADEQDASLLVVGTHGRGELAALILGSTSHRAIHLSQCDVMVVKSAEA